MKNSFVDGIQYNINQHGIELHFMYCLESSLDEVEAMFAGYKERMLEYIPCVDEMLISRTYSCVTATLLINPEQLLVMQLTDGCHELIHKCRILHDYVYYYVLGKL